MNISTIIGLVNNAALLLALGVLYDTLGYRTRGGKPTIQQAVTGVILGAIGIAVMLNPWEFTPGVVFDTRSVLLSVSGLFFGTLPTLLATLMTGGFRLYNGGAGAWTGVAVIVTSGAIGVAWRHLRRRELEDMSVGELYVMGVVVHIAMLLWMFSLPWPLAMSVLSTISLPVMVIYPVGTVLLGWLMVNRGARKRAEERIEHLNLVLRAIRNVNQLITRERNRDRLLQGACESLIETRGYHNAWIALLDESGGLVTTTEAGLGEDFLLLVEQLKRGELSTCGRVALSQPGVVAIEARVSTCADCPLSKNYGDMAAMAVRLEHGGKVYGVLTVRTPTDFVANEEERSLFQEVAADIAFALHSIELEEERKRAGEAIRELAKYPSENPNPVLRIAKDGAVLYANKASLPLLNLWGCQVGQPLPDDWREFTLKAFGFGVSKDAEVEVGDRILSMTFAPVVDAGYVNVYGLDITERKRAEGALQEHSQRLEEMVDERTQELREAHEKLVRQEKLAILGQLAGGVGHELRNPLGVISNAVYFLQMTLPDADETTKEYLEMISAEVRNSTRIISDLLDFSRTRMPDREEAAVSELVAEVLKKRPPPENVEATTEIAPDLPPVFVDPRQMGQVLGNLVVNAYQAMKEGGKLTISAQAEKGQVSLSVADTGCGIPPENMAKLFEPLFTTRAKGIGLGLMVVKNLVEANGGSIEAESEEGKGSTFTVRLPAAEGRG